jgi:hypothetical protein
MRGHIRERSPGHWAIVIDVRDPATGNRKRRWHSFEGTKRQAQIECARLVSELQHGGAIEPSRITVGQFLDRFERDWLATHVTARSAERYAYALKHVRRHLGDRSLQKLQPADLAALYAELFRGGLALPTIKLIHRVLHRALVHIVTELRQHWREQQELRLAMGLGKAPDDTPMFATPDGGYMNQGTVSRQWTEQVAAIGMPGVKLHSLRHTHASMLIAGGVDVLTVSRRLGHASPTITLNVYGHLIHGATIEPLRSWPQRSVARW